MNKLGKILEKLIRVSKQSREWRSFVFCLAAVVVFTTTYALILPAITVEKSTTDSVGGLVVEETDPGSTGAGAEDSGDVYTVETENEVSGEAVQAEAAGNTEAVEEVREPVNGEVLTVGDKKIMILTGEEFDVVVSSDLYAGVSDGTVLSVRGIPDANVVKSYSDRIPMNSSSSLLTQRARRSCTGWSSRTQISSSTLRKDTLTWSSFSTTIQ